jgi:fumarate reductase flavoprotein subunit
MSAAGTRIQAAKGIHDTPQLHYDDIMRISRNTANHGIVRLAVDNAADTLHWLLDNGFEPLPEHPIIHYGHEPYRIPRTYWGKDEGRSVLNVLTPQYEREEAAGGIETWLDTAIVGLTRDDRGAVAGAIVRRDGREVAVAADSVILATGGYSANKSLFPELSAGKPLYGGGYPYSQGKGLEVARAAGATVINPDLPAIPPAMGGLCRPSWATVRARGRAQRRHKGTRPARPARHALLGDLRRGDPAQRSALLRQGSARSGNEPIRQPSRLPAGR